MPNEPRIKDSYQREYYETHGRPMLLDYINAELKKQVLYYKDISNVTCHQVNLLDLLS
jgi:galactose-1-phosphate uridylyltransferase